MNFQTWVKNAIAKGVTVEEIARTFGVSKPTVHGWVEGTTEPHPSVQSHAKAELVRLIREM